MLAGAIAALTANEPAIAPSARMPRFGSQPAPRKAMTRSYTHLLTNPL
jgi:hypothetical protein